MKEEEKSRNFQMARPLATHHSAKMMIVPCELDVKRQETKDTIQKYKKSKRTLSFVILF